MLAFARRIASSSFDASVCEIGVALVSGACLCLPRANAAMPGPDLCRFLREQRRGKEKK